MATPTKKALLSLLLRSLPYLEDAHENHMVLTYLSERASEGELYWIIQDIKEALSHEHMLTAHEMGLHQAPDGWQFKQGVYKTEAQAEAEARTLSRQFQHPFEVREEDAWWQRNGGKVWVIFTRTLPTTLPQQDAVQHGSMKVNGNPIYRLNLNFYTFALLCQSNPLPRGFYLGRLVLVRDDTDGKEYYGPLTSINNLLNECNLSGRLVINGHAVGKTLSLTLPSKSTNLVGWVPYVRYDEEDDKYDDQDFDYSGRWVAHADSDEDDSDEDGNDYEEEDGDEPNDEDIPF